MRINVACEIEIDEELAGTTDVTAAHRGSIQEAETQDHDQTVL